MKGKKDPRRTLKHQIRKREGGFSRPDLSPRAAVTILYLIFISDFDCSPSWTCPDSRPCWLCEYIDQFLHEWLLFLCSLLHEVPLILSPLLWRKRIEVFSNRWNSKGTWWQVSHVAMIHGILEKNSYGYCPMQCLDFGSIWKILRALLACEGSRGGGGWESNRTSSIVARILKSIGDNTD